MLFLVLLASPSAADTNSKFTVQFELVCAQECLEPHRVDLELSPAGENDVTPQRFETTVPGKIDVVLPADVEWSVEVHSLTHFGPEQAVLCGNSTQSLEVHRIGYLSGHLHPAKGFEAPESLQVRWLPSRHRDLKSPQFSDCSIEDSAFRCRVPADTVDLRLHAPGFVPRYLWDVPIATDRDKDLDRLPLMAGGSVVGQLAVDNPTLGEVKLSPRLAGAASRDDQAQSRGLRRSASFNDHGFFQLADIPEGSYRLAIHHPEFSPSLIDPLDLETGQEIDLGLIELEPPITLHLEVAPATDIFGKPWTIELLRSKEDPTYLHPAYVGETDALGQSLMAHVDRNSYLLKVRDSQGQNWVTRTLDIQNDVFERIELPRTRLQVDIQLDDDPVTDALVKFWDLEVGTQMYRQTDAEGSAYFFLPKHRLWSVTIESKGHGIVGAVDDVEIPERKLNQRYPRLVLELPSTRLHGQVVDAAGELSAPVALEVSMVGTDPAKLAPAFQLSTQDDGAFEIRGLPEGQVSFQALVYGADGAILKASDGHAARLFEQQSSGPHQLPLREYASVDGQVIAPSGRGVPGAFVLAYPSGVGSIDAPPQTYTDSQGDFSLDLPKHSDGLQLVVFPPGFAPAGFNIRHRAEEPLLLPVEASVGNLRVVFGETPPSHDAKLIVETSLLKDGSFLGRGFILTWWANNQKAEQFPGELLVPNLAPGRYSACFGKALGNALAQGRIVAQETLDSRCVHGDLIPGGTLELAIPEELLRGFG